MPCGQDYNVVDDSKPALGCGLAHLDEVDQCLAVRFEGPMCLCVRHQDGVR